MSPSPIGTVVLRKMNSRATHSTPDSCNEPTGGQAFRDAKQTICMVIAVLSIAETTRLPAAAAGPRIRLPMKRRSGIASTTDFPPTTLSRFGRCVSTVLNVIHPYSLPDINAPRIRTRGPPTGCNDSQCRPGEILSNNWSLNPEFGIAGA